MTETQNSTNCSGLVSIIIPSRNSKKTIRTCISSIKQQTHKSIELIVIDGLSTDNTVSICRSMGARVIELEGERTKAKNAGISLSCGEFLFFVDSDMELEPMVIEECIKICSVDPKIGGVIVPERSVGLGFWIKVRDFERSFYSNSVIESARFFRKEYVILGIAIAAVILTGIFVPFQKANAFTVTLSLPGTTGNQTTQSTSGQDLDVSVAVSPGELVSVSSIDVIVDNSQPGVKHLVFSSVGALTSGTPGIIKDNAITITPAGSQSGYGYGFGSIASGVSQSGYSFSFPGSTTGFIGGNNVG